MKYLNYPNIRYALAGVAGLALALVLSLILLPQDKEVSHPIGSSTTESVHVHSDFLMYINDERVRFTDTAYQSDSTDIKHAHMHFHDGKDAVVHRHEDGVAFVEFLDSIGYDLTAECLTTDQEIKYFNQDENEVRLIVNGERVMDIEGYINQEEDKILVYYGDITSPFIRDYVEAVSDEACIYSGTCPERGIPPPENCGLTCDVADLFQE